MEGLHRFNPAKPISIFPLQPHSLSLSPSKKIPQNMSLTVFLLWLVSIPLTINAGDLQAPKPPAPPHRGFLLNCGSDDEVLQGGLNYVPDDNFTSTGTKSTVDLPNVHPILSTLRYFPDKSARKYCYSFWVRKDGKYLVKTTFFYGGFDGGKTPPVFDQIIDGTKWSTVNTTEDYANGLTSFYEIVVTAKSKKLSVCLGRNEHTVSDPFISALEVQVLEDSVYNATDFNKYALITVARNSFAADDGDMISFPDDPFNRLWLPHAHENPAVESHSNISSSEFWNFPPPKVFAHAITASRGKSLTVHWPPFALPSSVYYIALYFQDNRTPSPYSWRVFSVIVNGKNFYKDVNVSTTGATIYGTQWPLSGQTEIVLTPASDSPVGPIINAGEMFQVFPLGKRTLTRDVNALEVLARGFGNIPPDWHGDPCLPEKYSWTGITCNAEGKFARVTSLNLTGAGITGKLSVNIANLTALHNIWLGGNKLTGPIPDMGSLKGLKTLHLESNQFSGPIPESLGLIPELHEIFLENNNLDGSVPESLAKKTGLVLRVSPGNRLSKATS